MLHKTFMIVAGTLFGVIAVAHILRLVFAWPVVICTFSVPVWVSVVPAVLAGYLSVTAFRFKNK